MKTFFFLFKTKKPSIASIASKLNISTEKLCLMNLPQVPYSKIINTNTLLPGLEIKMKRIDPDFKFAQFVHGAVQGVVTVSNLIAEEKFDQLDGLVLEDHIEQIKTNYSKLNHYNKSLIGVKPRDISKKVIYNFEIFRLDKVYAEISLIFYYVPNLYKLLVDIENERVNRNQRVFKLSLIAADYKFIREYTPRSRPNYWKISELNHYHVF